MSAMSLDGLIKEKENNDEAFFYIGFYENAWSKENIGNLNYLLSLNNKEVDCMLWHDIAYRLNDDENSAIKFYQDADKSMLSDKSKKFLDKFFKTLVEHRKTNYSNFHNKDILTDRLILTAGDNEDRELCCKHLEEDGDFITFTNLKPTFYNIHKQADGICCIGIGPADNDTIVVDFVIKLKNNHKTIGVIGIYKDGINNSYQLQYYIFKPYRKNGYIYEAAKVLIHAVFSKNIKYPAITKYCYVYDEKKVDTEIIRIETSERNIGSIKLAKKLGFTYSGKITGEQIDVLTNNLLNMEHFYLLNKLKE